MPVSIAIIGAGPSGFYTAAALIKDHPDCRIDVIESLPTPYGLIRAGVAPDHQSTKGVSRAFAKVAAEPRVSYYGNVKIGRDVSIEELREIYDAVIFAVGAPLDRRLGIPGGDKPGSFGAAEFVGWYNGHPDYRDLAPDLNTAAVCVIGNGNVAVDVARVLAKTPDEMTESDLPDYAAKAIHAAPVTDIYMIGRRGAAEAKFTNKELSELGALADCEPVVDPVQLPEAVTGDLSDRDRRQREKNLATLRGFAGQPTQGKRKRLHFVVCAKPLEVLGEARVEGLRLEHTCVEDGRAVGTGEIFDIPCGLVVAAIGYRMNALAGAPIDERTGVIVNENGRVAPGLYVVGWAMRGPTGVIGTNKADGDRVAKLIREEVAESAKPGRGAFEGLLGRRRIRWVSFADWQRIDAAEIAAASSGAPREKLIRIKDMLAVLDEESLTVTKT